MRKRLLLYTCLIYLFVGGLVFAQANETNQTVGNETNITIDTGDGTTIVKNGTITNVIVTYSENHTIEVTHKEDVEIEFFNNWTENVTIVFPAVYPTWVNPAEGQDQTSFILDVMEKSNVTFTLAPLEDVGFFDRNIEFLISWFGGQERIAVTFRMTNIEPQSELSLDILTPEFEIDILKSDEGVIRVKNIHEIVPAWNVTFYCEESINFTNYSWCMFQSEQNRTFEVNETDLIVFSITAPRVQMVAQTNTSYNIPICTKGSNVAPVCRNMSVFIPYANQTQFLECPSLDIEEIFAQMTVFCARNPFSQLCTQTPLLQNTTVFVKLACEPENLTQEQMNLYSVCERDKRDLRVQNEFLLNGYNENMKKLTNETDQCVATTKATGLKVDGFGGQFTLTVIALFALAFVGAASIIFGVIKKVKEM